MIFKLSQQEYRRINLLYPPGYPNIAFVQAVIDGNILGDVWVEHSNKLKSALVVTKGGYCFIAGILTKEILHKYLALVKEIQDNKLVICHNHSLGYIFENFSKIKRISCLLNSRRALTPTAHCKNLTNFQVRKITADIINSCMWGRRMMNFYGNQYNLEINNQNICIIHENKIVAEAYSIKGTNCVEIGTVVEHNYRKLGLSSYLCSILIKHYLQDNFKIYWTCDESNIGSYKTALKLGYRKKQDYFFLHYPTTNI